MSLIAAACKQGGFGTAVPEFRFAAPLRQWRFDLAWPHLLVAFEREGFGAKWGGTGRHQRAPGMSGDCVKYNTALLNGWAVIRATPPMIRSGAALTTLLEMLKIRKDALT